MDTDETPDKVGAAPDLFSYLDFRKYLKDWFAARKVANPRYSHRVFARLAGQRSPSLLLLVIQGKRNLTERTLEGFMVALKLDRAEKRFFRALVDLDQASTQEAKARAWATISATRRFQNARRIEGEAVRYLSRWYYAAIRELAACPGFRADPDWVSRALRPRITTAQARDALDTLFELGMLQRRGEAIELTDATLVTPHEVQGLAAWQYHRNMMECGGAALESVPVDERHFGAVTVSAPPELMAELKAEVSAFQERILDLCDSAEGNSRKVIQVNIQLFPLSRAVSETS